MPFLKQLLEYQWSKKTGSIVFFQTGALGTSWTGGGARGAIGLTVTY